MQNITPNDWLQIAENDNFPFVANLLNALTFISNKDKMLEVLHEHLSEWSFTAGRAELIKTFYPDNHETIIAKWKYDCCYKCGACPEEVTCCRNLCYECYNDDDTASIESNFFVRVNACPSRKDALLLLAEIETEYISKKRINDSQFTALRNILHENFISKK